MSILLFLIIFEVVLHVTDYYAEPKPFRANVSTYDAVLGWKLKPHYVGIEDAREFKVVYQTNKFGFRNDDIIERDKKKIFFLGDSFTFGQGVEKDKIFTSLLEEKIPSHEIMNGGVPGYSTDQELLLLRNYGINYKPDIIVLNYLVENIARNENQFRRLSNPSTGLDYEKPRFSLINDTLVLLNVPTHDPESLNELLKENFTYSYKDYIKKYCYMCVFFYRNTKDILFKNKFDIYSSHYEKNSSSWLLTKKILEEMKKDADSIDAKFLIVIIPLQNDVLHDEERTLNYQLRFKELEREGFEILDLTPYLREYYNKEGINPYYEIDSHWNENGHRVGAEVTYRELIRRRLL